MNRRKTSLWAWSALLVVPALLSPRTPLAEEPPSPSPAATRFAWGDYDGDELKDAFVILASGQSGLLHNEGDGRLRDVTIEVGLDGVRFASFASWRDVDGDGQLDLFVATREGTHLFRKTPSGAFEDVAASLGLAEQQGVIAAHWLDYDADGRDDLHLVMRAGSVLLRRGREGYAPAELGATRLQTQQGASSGGQTLNLPNVSGAQYIGSEVQNFLCPDAIVDQADGVTCMSASSQPTPGFLYPITRNLFVASTGEVGINTVNPQARLHVLGSDAAGGAQDGFLSRGGNGNVGGVGATVRGGEGGAVGGNGLIVSGGRGTVNGGVAVIADGGLAELTFASKGGDGARLTGGDVPVITDYATGGAGAVIQGGYVGGYSSKAGAGAEITGGGTPPDTFGYTCAGDGAVITGGAGRYAGDGAVIYGGSGYVGGRGAVIVAGVGTSSVRTALRVEGRAPVNLAITTLGDVEVTGNICATGAIAVCSDERFKTDVEPLRGALETVLGLRGVSYAWRTEEFPERSFTEDDQLGFLAQQARAVVPEIVAEDSEGYLSIDYGKLTPLLVEALREQQATIDELEETVDRLSALEAAVEELQRACAPARQPR